MKAILKLAKHVVPCSLYNYILNEVHHRSGQYVCPVCSNRVGHFDRIGDWFLQGFVDNGCMLSPFAFETLNILQYACPRCGASDRARLYALYLSEYCKTINAETKPKILDVAPDPLLKDFIQRLGAFEYRSADLYSEIADDKIDITDMHIYEDGRFDFIICSHVLEHVHDDMKALAEISRVMKDSARALLMAPISLATDTIDEDPSLDERESWQRFGQGDHVRLYSRQGFIRRLSGAGFKVHEYGVNHFKRDAFKKAGITERSVVYIVEKVFHGPSESLLPIPVSVTKGFE